MSPLRFRLDGFRDEETFTRLAEALNALATSSRATEPPPGSRLASCSPTGSIDVQFALTPRGRRALESS